MSRASVSTPRRWTRALIAVLVLASLTASPARSQGDPWELSRAERERLEEDYGNNYWYENYSSAVEDLEDNKDAAGAADRLRFVIQTQPESSHRRQVRQIQSSIEYFPYLYLSIALSRLGRFEEAAAALAREDSSAVSQARRGTQELFATQRSTVDAQKSVGEYFAAFEWLRGAMDGDDVWWSGSGAAEAKALLDGLPSADAVDPAAVEERIKPAYERWTTLLNTQMRERATGLEELRVSGWGDAANSALLQRAGASCEPADAVPVSQAATLQQRFDDCLESTAAVLRDAGTKACRILGDERTAAQEAAQAVSARGGSAPAIPALPAGCSTDWASAPAASLQAAVAGLDFVDTRTAVAEARTTAQDTVNDLLAEQNRELLDLQQLIPTIPATCQRTLRLNAPARNLDEIAGRIDAAIRQTSSSLDFAAVRGDIETEVAALVSAAASAADGLVAAAESCQGVQAARFAPLPGLASTLRTNGDGSGLEPLCAAAEQAQAELTACYSKNYSLVLARAQGAALSLDIAEAWSAAVEPSDCLDESAPPLRQQLRRPRNNSGWISTTVEALDAAMVCLELYGAERATWESRLERQLSEGRQQATALGAAGGQAAAQVGRLKAAFDQGASGWQRLEPVLALDRDGLDIDLLRDTLEQSGFTGTVTSAQWTTVEGLNNVDQPGALATLRDAAVDSVALEIGAVVDRWSPLLGRLGAYTLLEGVFADVAGGRVESAIGTLRDAESAGQLPRDGRGAAVSHATMAYLLYLKMAAAQAAGGGPLTDALEEEAAREVRRARRADEAFAPSAALFTHPGFQAFYDAS